ncbi:MAG: PQQ-binding-like beta-propeller repeat protein [Vicinamibacterales bacterium]
MTGALLCGWFGTAVHPASAEWPTLGANQERTSAVREEVRGPLSAAWYRPFEPYINYKTQVIAADGRLFVSTARGLYALDSDTGAMLWVYPTETPLGHSPTYAGGTLYVGSYDRTIHRIDAATGQRMPGWTPHVAGAGFETNPLVSNGRIYAGNRDGYFYCLDAITGALRWRFRTGAAIRNSAAMDASNTIYFASEDLHAYALQDAGDQERLLWRSSKLLGDTFSTYWPVVYRDWVIFSGGMGYFYRPPYGDGVQLMWDDKNDIDANLTARLGREPGDWAPGTVTMNAAPLLEHYETKPHRRRVFLLNRATGEEYTFDSDGDGRPEYAPLTFSGVTQSGSKYPPVVGHDGVLYSHVAIVSSKDLWTPAGALVGWKVGTATLSRVMEWEKADQAADEPMAFSIGGDLAYWNLCCDRESGSFDLSVPFGVTGRWWLFWAYSGRFQKLPDYEPMYDGDDGDGWGVYGGPLGIYGKHGAQNPWIPYRGKLFRIMGNSVVALARNGRARGPLGFARTASTRDMVAVPTVGELKNRLAEEIEKVLAAGHLKPGLFRSNVGDYVLNGNGRSEMDQGIYYFSSPGDTIYALLRALPHLPKNEQTKLREHIQKEMSAYPLDVYASVGHREGTPRQAAVVPPEYAVDFTVDKKTDVYNNRPWRFPLMAFYAAWKYAQIWPAEGPKLYQNLRAKLTLPAAVTDDALRVNPQVLNAYLAGYLGFLELERTVGRPESADVRREYDRLLEIRLDNVSLDLPYQGEQAQHLKNFRMARHFMFLVPEIAKQLRTRRLKEVAELVGRIDQVTPYWFVEGYDATSQEGTHQQLYDVATFNAHAMILQTPYAQLVKYLDAPVFQVGDWFYLHNLISAIEAVERENAATRPAAVGQAASVTEGRGPRRTSVVTPFRKVGKDEP